MHRLHDRAKSRCTTHVCGCKYGRHHTALKRPDSLFKFLGLNYIPKVICIQFLNLIFSFSVYCPPFFFLSVAYGRKYGRHTPHSIKKTHSHFKFLGLNYIPKERCIQFLNLIVSLSSLHKHSKIYTKAEKYFQKKRISN